MENIKLNKRSDLHVIRKVWHVLTGLAGLTVFIKSGMAAEEMAAGLFVLSAMVFVLEFFRLRNEKLNEVVIKIMGPFMRKSEVKQYSGFAYYSMGVSLSLFLFPEKYAVLSALFLMFADPISSTVGILYGTKKILPNKSIEGTLGCAFTCFIITVVYMNHFGLKGLELIVFSLLAALIASISELLSFWVDDNLTIPTLSGLGLTIVSYLMNLH